MSSHFRSLFVTSIFGLLLPLCVIAIFFVVFFVLGLIPSFQTFSIAGTDQIVRILQIFGNGNPFQGSFVIGVAVSTVAMLFDMCNLFILSKPIR